MLLSTTHELSSLSLGSSKLARKEANGYSMRSHGGVREDFVLTPCYGGCVTPQSNEHTLNENLNSYSSGMSNMANNREAAWEQSSKYVKEFRDKVRQSTGPLYTFL